MQKVNIIDMVKVKSGIAAAIKETVSVKHFYRKDNEEKLELLNDLAQEIVNLYGRDRAEGFGDIEVIKIDEDLDYEGYGFYEADEKNIYLGKLSMISFLNYMRKHILNVGGVEPQLGLESLDRLAWSTRAFKLACPNSFEKSVKAGHVANLVWDDDEGKAFALLSEEIISEYLSTDEE